MTVRETFHQLEAEGLNVVYPRQGAFVNRLNIDEIQELYDIRILQESDALRRAVTALAPAILAEAGEILAKLARGPMWPRFWQARRRISRQTLHTANCPRLLDLINTLRNQVTQFLSQAVGTYMLSPNLRM